MKKEVYLVLKKLLSIIVVTIVLFIIFVFTQKTSTSTMSYETTENKIILNKSLNLREGPGLSYPSSAYAKEGQAFSKIEQKGEWIHVANGEQSEGWIPTWYTTTNEKQQQSSKMKVAVSNVDGLNVRAQPTTSSAVLKQLTIGEEVKVINEENGWVKIDDSLGTFGWVSKDYIQLNEKPIEEKDEPKSPISTDDTTFSIQVHSVNVRTEPNPSSPIVESVNKDDSFEIIEEENNWVKIKLSEEKEGWISRFYGVVDTSITSNQNVDSITIIYGGTNLRESASTSSPVVKRADIGERFEILSTEGEWYKVAINAEETAYVAQWVVSANLNEESTDIENEPKIERKKGTLNGITIVLDPGHGGNDQGTAGYRGSIEKDITLMTAQLLQSKLQDAGATVYLTRESDMYVDLRKRVSIAHSYSADAFISIHYDATNDMSVSGFTTYYYHDYQQELAQYVNEGIADKVSIRDRGSQIGDYLVIRENYQNGILIELGYLSNPTEERVITTDFYREQATLGIYEGIIDYFDAQLEE